ncbi:glucosyltransferase domain-containing protein [Microvirga sp. BSC39]|uniref:glucosyltransferase domain-containing protein n=1 Tax=Microvirga sp. BSC39 TaxID=1549810 RepID=UPI0009DCB6DF|nr:glucosyltransferase domain-containing protein [Microvirga sp. BSC39]
MNRLAFTLKILGARYSIPIIVVTIMGFIARGQAIFTPLYSIDTYQSAYNKGPGASYDFLLSQGRFGLAALWWLRDALGFYGIEVSSASLILSVILFAIAGVLFALSVFEHLTPGEAFIFTAVFTLHPFNTEFFHFADATFNIVFAIFLAAAGIALAFTAHSNWIAIAGGATLIALSLSIYQLAIAHIGTVWLAALVARVVYPTGTGNLMREHLARSGQALITTAAGLVLYLVSIFALRHIFDISLDGRTDFSQLVKIHEKLQAVGRALQLTLWPDPSLIPRNGSLLVIALIITCSTLITWRSLKKGNYAGAMACLVFVVVGLAWSSGASVAGAIIWLVPRVLSPVSVFIAALLVLAWHGSSRLIRGALATATCILCIFYVGVSNHILFDQRRLNLWDAQEANRIIARIEQQPQFSQVTSLAIIGGKWRRSSGLSTTTGDMNVSALAVAWAKVGLIEQSTGYRFSEPTAAEWAVARTHCTNAPLWPAIESTTIINALGIVCLTRPSS